MFFKLNSELEAARLARRKENRERENLLTRFATMLDALPGGVIILDSDGLITEANPQARTLLGEPLEGRLGNQLSSEADLILKEASRSGDDD